MLAFSREDVIEKSQSRCHLHLDPVLLEEFTTDSVAKSLPELDHSSGKLPGAGLVPHSVPTLSHEDAPVRVEDQCADSDTDKIPPRDDRHIGH